MPAGAFYGVLAFPVQGVKVIRVMLQLELQPGAALVFGEVHGPILRERTRGISYQTPVYRDKPPLRGGEGPQVEKLPLPVHHDPVSAPVAD
ncbi:hypothetical protein TbrSNM41_23110 (plasmid) [Thermus brockianus]|uniref:Uncharacterized protein n=1 Tax=Thermus brockianus TaxID=56956 RepID=A0ABN6NMA8_THEBO|nr:hypothetical protein TbrSNM41_23110 [Thermus brockianus]